MVRTVVALGADGLKQRALSEIERSCNFRPCGQSVFAVRTEALACGRTTRSMRTEWVCSYRQRKELSSSYADADGVVIPCGWATLMRTNDVNSADGQGFQKLLVELWRLHVKVPF